MNLNDPQHPWTRLTAAARTIADDRETAAPYGFATRVSAIAFASSWPTASLVERFALRALGVACLLAIGTVVTNFSVVSSVINRDDGALVSGTGDDPVGELVNAATATTID